MLSAKRPIGISILALVSLSGAISFFVTAVLFAAAPHILASSGFKLDPQPLERLFGLVFFGVCGGLLVHGAYCLWTLRPWGRTVGNGIAFGGLVVVFNEVLRGSPDPAGDGLLFLGCAAILWYLSRPRVRSSFEAVGQGN